MKKSVFILAALLLCLPTFSKTINMCVKLNDSTIVKYDTYDLRNIYYEREIVKNLDTVYSYVDLGLPSGTLWATFNVGASKDIEYGDFFSWGDYETKKQFNESTDKWYEGNGYTKYKELDTLLSEDDAATVNWGADWRMPTQEECQELLDNCKITSKLKNQVRGRLFESNNNGQSIFLPYAGTCYDTIVQSDFYKGFYWLSTCGSFNNSSGYTLEIDVEKNPQIISHGRFAGMTIRPVYTLKASEIEAPLDTAHTLLSIDTFNYMCLNHYSMFVKKYDVKDIDEVTFETILTLADTSSYDYPYVDLGLPSGTKWATFNVGATKPEEYGNMFAWGEIKESHNFSDKTYRWGENYWSNKEKILKYSYGKNSMGSKGYYDVDSIGILLPEDDAATANWGADWRTPTTEDFHELNNNCEHSWETLNGIKGIKFTAKNGNWIFLPSAGYSDGQTRPIRGQSCCYQTSTLSNLDDWGTVYYNGKPEDSDCYYTYRFYGLSVRPVRAK